MTAKKTILITGAASGIGRETALYFAKMGWFVGATDIDEKGLNSLESEIGSENVFKRTMDVTDPDSVQCVVDEFASQTISRFDVLFNNAGYIKFGFFENVDIREYHRVVNVNINGILNCTHFAAKYLKNTPGAHIVNMASLTSLYGIPDISVYSATKRAVLAITEAMNIEFEPHGVTVCDIIAPYVNTPFLDVPETVYSKEKMGVKMEPITVAKTVWKAAHGKKIHWRVGMPTHLLTFLFWLMPFIKRPFVKNLTVMAS